MRKNLLIYTMFLALLMMAIVVAGCPQQQTQEPAPQQQQQQEPQAQFNLSAITQQWSDSGHANFNAYPSGRDGCILCHNGYAFANQVSELAALPDGRKITVGETTSGITPVDCQACHTGHATNLMEAGQVSIPTQENVTAGRSALCVACHNPRRAPDINDERRSAPHSSAQSDVFFGTGGIRGDNFQLGNSAHQNIENPCISCHMTRTNDGASHNFTIGENFVQEACGRCHQGINNTNLQARADYDGDGNTEGFQDEVQGLLETLKAAIEEEIGGTFESAGGAIVFTANGAEMAPADVPNEVYLAAYNYQLVFYDGSLGVHNPSFAVQLLQQSYRSLTGEDIPNAQAR